MWYKGLCSKEINVAWDELLFEHTIMEVSSNLSGVDLELNNWASLITGLIIVATIVCSQMIPGLAHLIDCTTTGLISKITSYLGQKPKYII